jgi:serine/threonine protein phosphatase PrpC
MNYESVTMKNKSRSVNEVERNLMKTLKNLEKSIERRNRKREKMDSDTIGLKPPRIPLCRIKRKPGHRERRPEVTAFEHDIEVQEFPVPPPTIMTMIDTAVKQLCCQQDVVVALTIDSKQDIPKEEGDLPIDVIAVLDGHGDDLVPNLVRELDFAHHFQQANTPSSIQTSIQNSCQEKKAESDKREYIPSKMSYKEYMKQKITKRTLKESGTTYSAVYVQRNNKTGILKLLAEWVGDSPIFILVNGELVFEATTHHTSNDKEVEFMKQKGFITNVTSSKYGFQVISENEIKNEPGKYAHLKDGDGAMLACTRSLGHNGITCIEGDRVTIHAKLTDDVKVIVCSDGVGDMLHLEHDIEKLKTYSAELLVDLAESRWKQEWNYHGTMTKFPSDGYDDCSAAVWWQKKSIITCL